VLPWLLSTLIVFWIITCAASARVGLSKAGHRQRADAYKILRLLVGAGITIAVAALRIYHEIPLLP
jgi:hypothetical protein